MCSTRMEKRHDKSLVENTTTAAGQLNEITMTCLPYQMEEECMHQENVYGYMSCAFTILSKLNIFLIHIAH